MFSANLFAIFKAIYWGNCTWLNLPRLTAPSIWFREFELDNGYLMTYCFSRKISGREIAGVWTLATLVTADWSTGDFQRWREMSESDVSTSLYLNGLSVVLVLSGSLLTDVLIIITYISTGYLIVLQPCLERQRSKALRKYKISTAKILLRCHYRSKM